MRGREAFGARRGESDVIARARGSRDSGLSYADVAATLNDEGAHCRRAGSLWNPGSIFRVLKAADKLPAVRHAKPALGSLANATEAVASLHRAGIDTATGFSPELLAKVTAPAA